MGKLMKEKFYSLYNQIGLYDTEDQNSYPQWGDGLELVVFGKKGVAISVKGDIYVEVTIYSDSGGIDLDGWLLYGKGYIHIGNKGVTVGNEASGNTKQIEWDQDSTLVKVYGNGEKFESTSIIIIMTRVN